MFRNGIFSLPVGLLAVIGRPTLADLPYNPTQIFVSPNQDEALAYAFTPQASSSQFQLLALEISSTINSTSLPFSTLSPSLPFLDQSTAKPFTPIIDSEGDITVFTGDCGTEDNELWRFTPDKDGKNGTWTQVSTLAQDGSNNMNSVGVNFLSAGASFSPTGESTDLSFYMFGGMCPNPAVSSEDWTSNANYSNAMLSIMPDPSASSSSDGASYEIVAVASRGAPIAEAGFTMTPLFPTFSNSTGGNQSQQQNFALIGGHTQQAFINMSQIALFSLPEQSWGFIPVDQPDSGTKTDLTVRGDAQVEPRSGHTAVLTPDGSAIVVLGGWVGDIHTPATPQVAVLKAGQGYGGTGDWVWSVPDISSSPFASGSGIYGHGATMLSGGVMLVSGGYSIPAPSSKRRRASQTANFQTYLFNTTTNSFISTYTNPSTIKPSPVSSSSGGALSSTSAKAGLGAGIGLGLSALAGVVGVYLFYSQRLRKRRQAREQELRELALGAQRFHAGLTGDGEEYTAVPSNSWHKRKNSAPNDAYPWAPAAGSSNGGVFGSEGSGWRETGVTDAERTGLLVEIPSPTRGLRRSLHTRPYLDMGQRPTFGPGGIHPIDERGEDEDEIGKQPEMRQLNPGLDPFRDPPPEQFPAEKERQKEIQGWVDDWSAAAAAMDLGHSNTVFRSEGTGRSTSPEKSDRTISNLSERSTRSNLSNSSIQRSVAGTISRGMSQRSASAAQALFASAAAANRAGYTIEHNDRSGSPERPGTGYRRSQSLTLHPRVDTFTTAHTSLFPHQAENDALLGGVTHENYATPPESPTRSYHPPPGAGRRALGWMGSVKRVLTGGSLSLASASLRLRPERSNSITPDSDRTTNSSPTKGANGDMSPRRAASASATLWRSKKGARDWDAELGGGEGSSSTIKPIGHGRNCPEVAEQSSSGDSSLEAAGYGDDVEDWDVEKAVQKRLVQVMFTVPKEKLRVVNLGEGDALSVSDAGGEQQDDGGGSKMEKMDRVDEEDDDDATPKRREDKGKGVDRSR